MEYDILTFFSYNIICLAYQVIEECIGKYL